MRINEYNECKRKNQVLVIGFTVGERLVEAANRTGLYPRNQYILFGMPQKSKFSYLKNINIFDGKDDFQMKMVEKMTTMSQVGKHHPIHFPEQLSSNIFFLKEGHVKLYRHHEDGREVILDILGPGEIFGEMSIVDQGGRREAANDHASGRSHDDWT